MTEYRAKPLEPNDAREYLINYRPFRSILPNDAVGTSVKSTGFARSPLTLHWRDRSGLVDMPLGKDGKNERGFFRPRKSGIIKQFFDDLNPQTGDIVIVERLGSHELRLHLERADGTRVSGTSGPSKERERIKNWALRETRPKQQEFRRKIAERDGLKCAITGCEIEEILDAAHLAKRAPGGSDDPSNGMILRADIHRLLDAGLLRIDTTTRTVVVEERGADATYGGLSGRTIQSAADLSNLPPMTVATS